MALHVEAIKGCAHEVFQMFEEKGESYRIMESVDLCGQAPQEKETHRRRIRKWSRKEDPGAATGEILLLS